MCKYFREAFCLKKSSVCVVSSQVRDLQACQQASKITIDSKMRVLGQYK
jgi:hypothetical protein